MRSSSSSAHLPPVKPSIKHMAANKFATFILRNTNRFTLILTYALLEWILILLLLLNSLFSHLIVKFADAFGLKPPCPWCTSPDRIFRPQKGTARVDLLCEFHATEISELCYCSNHRKLSESRDICGDCSPRLPSEGGAANSNCSCCGVCLDDYALFSSYMLIKALSWNVLDDSKKHKLITKDDYFAELCDGENVIEIKSGNEKEKEIEVLGMENLEEKEGFPLHLEFLVDYSGRKSVLVELVDSIGEDESRGKIDFKIEDHENGFKGCEVGVEENEVHDVDLNKVLKSAMLESMEMEEAEDPLVFHAKDPELDDHTAVCKEVAPTENNGNKTNVSIKTHIPDLNVPDHTQNQESYECTHQGDVEVIGTKKALDEEASNIERLKSELRAEQESVQALYAELEEERNCSDVAANQTMAMINRLQEEKAAIQMEAFQYQRLMEEQSEYDQEALQLLNDLLVKREKENQELAKELEVCKKKILDYETKENNGGVMMSFEECLAEFEDERLSILGQLQVLEDNDFVKEKNGKSLIDANNGDNEKGFDSNGVHNCYVSKLKEEKTVRDLYERLEALGSDRDFFKNYVGSLKKGEKGIDLLQKIMRILRHLRDSELPHVPTLMGTSEDDECMYVV